MDFLTWFAVFIVAKTTQYVWTLYMIGVLVKDRLKYGKVFFKKVEHKKPSCLEGWNEDYLQLNNIRMHYVQTGKDDAPLLLMLHGFPEFWYSWKFQLRHFEKDYRCVAIDMRGYNLTDKPSNVSDYQLPILANDVKQVIKKLGYKKAFLMAHDWGAGVAWRTAQMFPDHIEKLIILNTPHPNANSFEQFYKSWSLKDLKFVKGEDKFVKPPTLIMFPTADIYMSQTAAEKSLKYCRNGQIKIIEGASHWLMQDEPVVVNQYVEDFLAGEEKGGGSL